MSIFLAKTKKNKVAVAYKELSGNSFKHAIKSLKARLKKVKIKNKSVKGPKGLKPDIRLKFLRLEQALKMKG